uniref:OPA3-like protein n=1 Tax=Plectus sambesii TaxID=2011161 RepID=A0A914XC65_9BILA
MPLPLIKLGVLVLKQLSKPLANGIKNSAKERIFFRTKMVVPLGQFINRLTTRGNMWRLGLGKPTKFTPLTEQAAVELGSETVGEVVIWGIALGTFFGIEWWSSGKAAVKEAALKDRLSMMESRLELLESTQGSIPDRLQGGRAILAAPSSSSPSPSSSTPSSSPQSSQQSTVVLKKPSLSLPIDEAVKVVAGNLQFLVTRRGAQVLIEPYESAAKRGAGEVRKRQPLHVDSLIVRSANYARGLMYRSTAET